MTTYANFSKCHSRGEHPKGCTVCKRLRAEGRNVAQVVTALRAAGHSLSVHDGEETTLRQSVDKADVMQHLGTTDADMLVAHNEAGAVVGRVWLVYGNADDGSEVVSDYSMTLVPILEPITDKWG